MSDLKRLLIFFAVMAFLVIAAHGMTYQDDAPNPWHVGVAFTVLVSSPYWIGALLIGWVLWLVARPRDHHER